MAKNEVVVTIKGNTSQFTRELDTLKGKIKEALGANAFSLAEISPFKFLSDGIRNAIMGVVDALRNAEAEAAKVGDSLRQSASQTSLTNAEFISLKSSADNAGVSVGQFADALDRLKEGRATLADIQRDFEAIAATNGMDSLADRRAARMDALQGYRNLVASYAVGIESSGGFWESLGDNLTGANRSQAASYFSRLVADIHSGERRTYYTPHEIAQETGDILSAKYDQALAAALNAELAKVLERERKETERAEAEKAKAEAKAEEERKRANEAAAREAEARQREEEARNSRLARDFDQMRDAGITREDALATLAVKYGLEGDALEAALNAGTWANYDPVAEAIKAARGQRNVSTSSPHKYLADENDGDGITEGDLNATWLTAGGGSLLRGGSGAALAMGRRMRAISIQEQLLDRLDRVAANTETTAQAAQQVADNTAE